MVIPLLRPAFGEQDGFGLLALQFLHFAFGFGFLFLLDQLLHARGQLAGRGDLRGQIGQLAVEVQ